MFVEYLSGESAQISNGNPEIATTMKKSVARRTATSCKSLCEQANKGDGKIVGTAPFCGRKCGRDCPDSRLCTIATRTWTDYGIRCLTGNKICCCCKFSPNVNGLCYNEHYLNNYPCSAVKFQQQLLHKNAQN